MILLKDAPSNLYGFMVLFQIKREVQSSQSSLDTFNQQLVYLVVVNKSENVMSA